MTTLSPEERKGLLLSVGTHRGKRPLSPIEVATLFQRDLASGNTTSQLALLVQLSPTMVGRFVKLLDLSKDIRHLIGWQGADDGSVSFTSAFEMARLRDGQDHLSMASAILEHSLSSAETRQAVQLRLRSHRPISECINEVVGMRPVVEVRHVYIGTVLEEALRRRLSALTQAERDALLRDVLLKDFSHLAVRTGRLGPARFTLVGGAELGEAARGTLERDLNDRLAGSQ